MSEWTDITVKVKKKLPILDREFLDSYYDEYCTRRGLLMFYKRKLNFSKIAPFKEQNIEYILSTGWETILKDQLHKIVTKYKFHRSLESRFFMDVVRLMISSEIAQRVKPYLRERIAINDGMLNYEKKLMFGTKVWTFFNVEIHVVEKDYYRPWDSVAHPKLFVRIWNDRHGGTYRQELDKFIGEIVARLDAVCCSENMQIKLGTHVPGVELKSIRCPWVDWRKQNPVVSEAK